MGGRRVAANSTRVGKELGREKGRKERGTGGRVRGNDYGYGRRYCIWRSALALGWELQCPAGLVDRRVVTSAARRSVVHPVSRCERIGLRQGKI